MSEHHDPVTIDLTDIKARTPVDLGDEIRRATALVIHALGLGGVALLGALVARLVQALT